MTPKAVIAIVAAVGIAIAAAAVYIVINDKSSVGQYAEFSVNGSATGGGNPYNRGYD